MSCSKSSFARIHNFFGSDKSGSNHYAIYIELYDARTVPWYAGALKYCGAGHEEKDLVRVVIDKNISFKQKIALFSHKAECAVPTVFDLGATNYTNEIE